MKSIIENINLKVIKTLDDLNGIVTKEEIFNKSRIMSYLKNVVKQTMIAPKILKRCNLIWDILFRAKRLWTWLI